MNEKLELLNAVQAELEGMGIKISRIGVQHRRTFGLDGELEEHEVLELTMPCQSGFYHARCAQKTRGQYEVEIVREITAELRNLKSVVVQEICKGTVRQLDGPSLKKLFVDAVTIHSIPYMQDFALVAGNWPVPGTNTGQARE